MNTKAKTSLNELWDDFRKRHIGPDDGQTTEMLNFLGLKSLNQLIDLTIPKNIRTKTKLNIGPPKTENEALLYLEDMANNNQVHTSMIGMGYYGTITPGVILRNVLENPGWYTAYTPYQAEVSQGRLEALINFQQMVIDLTSMEIANASLLDEATAAAEGMSMARRVSTSDSNIFFVDSDAHPQTIAVVLTRAKPLGIEVKIDHPKNFNFKHCFGSLLQYPGSSGEVYDVQEFIKKSQKANSISVVATDLMALCLLKPPGEMGADIVIGSAQRFGVPLGYGGPHAAFFATKEKYKRTCPGRIIGASVDSNGQSAFRMALQTREQHIRRDKATSNICTAQVLLAVIAGFYAVYHGPEGLKKIASRIHFFTQIFANYLTKLNYKIVNNSYFDTLKIYTPGKAKNLAKKAEKHRINVRVIGDNHVGISFDETTSQEILFSLSKIFNDERGCKIDLNKKINEVLPQACIRSTQYLDHPIFNKFRSETEMLRYIRWLSSRDIALDQSMIPLGSCTMKLNSTSEMMPVSWKNFSSIHPFAPLHQTKGYQKLFRELENMLKETTGFAAISLQPNAGSQGEFAGLMTIRKYLDKIGQSHRNICLIPSSAHGTNPASAVMAGMNVIVIDCDSKGNIDLEDLNAKCTKHKENIAALMVTYPSTHGVFEESILEICRLVHQVGGQVYMDGANLNAMIGLCLPSEFGVDVAHMNLHKTFCIPHGGGGPGVGPIGVKKHLAPFLPSHVEIPSVNKLANYEKTLGAVSSAPWGSASILPISWAYIFMMGDLGLKTATEIAILNANYIAARLAPYYPILYTGKHGKVAHECILDMRQLKESSGISVDDIAKRLIDYGFHSPTMSFPVSDTLMVEPTESESKNELDRFCEAMISIRKEIKDVESGNFDKNDNVLKNAPHTYHLLLETVWPHKYSKTQAYFPLNFLRDKKYWPPVGRIDNVFGDRNLACGCPDIESYRYAAE